MLNNWCGQGRLVRDIELRYTASQVAVASFTIACDRDFKSKDGERETDWIDVVAWSTSAEFVHKYFHKGDMIVVSGRIQTRTYDDKNGNKRKATEVVGTSFNFCGSKNGQGGAQQNGNYQQGGGYPQGGNYQQGGTGNAQQYNGQQSGNRGTQYGAGNPYQGSLDDFMSIPDGFDESLPFN